MSDNDDDTKPGQLADGPLLKAINEAGRSPNPSSRR